MRFETAFNLCTISSRAISSFLSQNLILPQNKTILCSSFPLHQKVLHGWGSVSGEGARLRGWGWGGDGSAFLPGIGPQPRQGLRPAPGWGLLGGSGSAPATRTPAATRELRLHPCGHLEALHVHFQGHQGALRVHLVWSPGTQVCTPTDRLIVPCVHPSET